MDLSSLSYSINFFDGSQSWLAIIPNTKNEINFAPAKYSRSKYKVDKDFSSGLYPIYGVRRFNSHTIKDYGWICFSNAIKTGEKNHCDQWKQAHLFKTSRAAKLPAVLSTHYSLYVYKYKLNHRKEEEEGQNKLHAWFSKEKCLSMSWHSEVLQHGYSAVHHVANISFVVCAWVWFTCNVKKFLQISYFTRIHDCSTDKTIIVVNQQETFKWAISMPCPNNHCQISEFNVVISIL